MTRWLLVALAAASPAAYAAQPTSVVGSKHDLSVSGPGPLKAQAETEVCIFCHVSHAAGPERLTSRPDLTAKHRPYESSTSAAAPRAPTGASRICLSCHDGTIALGDTRARRIQMGAATVGGRLPPGRRSNLGTDLRSTHPVSFQPTDSAQVRRPARADPVRLDHAGRLECTSCHDPHREFAGAGDGMFLVKTNRRSELCRTCHAASTTATHAVSTVSLKSASARVARFGSPAEAGCSACHASHGADPAGRLLDRTTSAGEDDVCLDCHATPATQHDLGRDVAKRFSHAVSARGVHDAAEGPRSARPIPEVSSGSRRHAACVDCHEPHASESRPATAPAASGALAGVWGIDLAGERVQPVRYEYEVCFKCHADSMNQPQALGSAAAGAPQRARPEANLRVVFAPGAASFHPVAAAGRNTHVPGLVAPLTEASFVYCTDCHASDSGAGVDPRGARGPHGSTLATLLERNYETRDGTVESKTAYALCYKCHDRQVLLSSRSGFSRAGLALHARHVVQERTPCSACHTAHGVPLRADTATGNHLVDFDLSIVRGVAGPPRYDGSCTLMCHGKAHHASRY